MADDDEEVSLFDQYKCYCNKCGKWLAGLQSACGSCDSMNYRKPCEVNDDGEEECPGEDEQWMYGQHCVINQLLIAEQQDSFCNLFDNSVVSATCMQEMEYIVNPPKEEEDDGNNRRRLGNDNNDNGVDDFVEAIAACWLAPFNGGCVNMGEQG